MFAGGDVVCWRSDSVSMQQQAREGPVQFLLAADLSGGVL